MNTPGVVRQAIVLVNEGEPLGLPEWAQVVVACRDMQNRSADGAVELAAAVSRVVTSERRPYPLADAVRAWPDARTEQIRVVLAMVTRATRRGDQPKTADALLAGVERAALAPDPGSGLSDLNSALARWRGVVADVGGRATPQLAAAIGQHQLGLLTITRDLAARIDLSPSPPIDTERLFGGLDACRDAWHQAVAAWRTAPPGPAPTRADATAISLAAVELRDALLSRPPADATLASLVRSGVGGNLLIAAALDPDPTSSLTSVARRLDALTTRMTDDSLALTLTTPASVTSARPESPPQASRPMAAAPSHQVATASASPASEAVRLTIEIERELAGRRDTGVVAQAALDGVPSALALLSGASASDLARLTWQGRQAVGVLVASVRGAIWSHAHRYPAQADERFATAAAAVAAAVHNWDPDRARWLTWAIKVSDWSMATLYRTELALPRPLSMDIDCPDSTHGTIDPTLLTSDLPDPGETAAAHLDGARAARLVERLPWPDNKILSDAMGFGSGQPQTVEAIARRVGMPRSTVRAHLCHSLEQVRRQMGVDR